MSFPLFKKDPSAVLDYGFDWETWLNGDTINASEWVVPSGITEDSDSNTSLITKIWLSGGTVGETYTIVNRIVTAGGRTNDRTFQVTIKEQ